VRFAVGIDEDVGMAEVESRGTSIVCQIVGFFVAVQELRDVGAHWE
jgi:hypothetical protein